MNIKWLSFYVFTILSCKNAEQQTTIIKESPAQVKYADKEEALPACDLTNIGNTFYIGSEDLLVLCNANQWKKIISKGEKGEKGLQGSAGAQGEKGATGQQGLAGREGVAGSKGATGATGAQGKKGKDAQDLSDYAPIWRQIWSENISKVALLDIYYKSGDPAVYVITRASAFLVASGVLATTGHNITDTVTQGSVVYTFAGIYAKFPNDEKGDSFSVTEFVVDKIDKTYGYQRDIVLLNLMNPPATTPVRISSRVESIDPLDKDKIVVGTSIMSIGFVGGTDFAHLTQGTINAIQDVVYNPGWWSDFIGNTYVDPNAGNIIYETDLVASNLGVGAPVFDQEKQVIGIVMVGDDETKDTEFTYVQQAKHLNAILASTRSWQNLPLISP